MPSRQADQLSELQLDALWTVFEGHSLVIEYPQQGTADPTANVIMAVAYEDGEAVAEVTEIPLDVAQGLIEAGLLERSADGPVLSESSWFDDELGVEIKAEEYVLSDAGNRVIDNTADGPGTFAEDEGWDEDEDDEWDEDDEDDWDEEEEDEWDEDDDWDDEDEDE